MFGGGRIGLPLTVRTCGLSAASSVMVTVAVSRLGLLFERLVVKSEKATTMMQLRQRRRCVPQFPDVLNCDASVPPNVIARKC